MSFHILFILTVDWGWQEGEAGCAFRVGVFQENVIAFAMSGVVSHWLKALCQAPDRERGLLLILNRQVLWVINTITVPQIFSKNVLAIPDRFVCGWNKRLGVPHCQKYSHFITFTESVPNLSCYHSMKCEKVTRMGDVLGIITLWEKINRPFLMKLYLTLLFQGIFILINTVSEWHVALNTSTLIQTGLYGSKNIIGTQRSWNVTKTLSAVSYLLYIVQW